MADLSLTKFICEEPIMLTVNSLANFHTLT